jgi:propionate CoA-transferase
VAITVAAVAVGHPARRNNDLFRDEIKMVNKGMGKFSKEKKNKVMTVDEAVRLIDDGATVTTGGFCGAGFAEHIAIHLGKRFEAEQQPKGLTMVYCAGQGDFKTRGLNHLGKPGMVKRIIAGHYGASPMLSLYVIKNEIEAYNFPQGVISQMFRDIAAKKPRTITKVGLKTFVDPRLEGGKISSITTESLVDLVEYDGQEYLSYKTFPLDIAILRGTSADEDGNIALEREALVLESLAQAMAVKSCGGKVIVQVEQIVQRGSLRPKDVVIPGILVDAVVVADKENHWQTFDTPYNPSFSGEARVPMESIAPLKMGTRKIIARRAAFELRSGAVVNLGIGMPEGIANIANEEGVLEMLTLTAEPGIIGGMPASGLSFGASYNPEAIIDQPSQFDFYHGGGLDLAFLGLAQADRFGNLNVSRFGPKLAGAGGFIDITQNAKKVIFTGTFTAGGLQTGIEGGQLTIVQEGKFGKFVNAVEQVTFSGPYAVERKQPVLFITERCVFELTAKGLALVEIAPGIDLQKDILDQMEFAPDIPSEPQLMDRRIFLEKPMGLINDPE